MSGDESSDEDYNPTNAEEKEFEKERIKEKEEEENGDKMSKKDSQEADEILRYAGSTVFNLYVILNLKEFQREQTNSSEISRNSNRREVENRIEKR